MSEPAPEEPVAAPTGTSTTRAPRRKKVASKRSAPKEEPLTWKMFSSRIPQPYHRALKRAALDRELDDIKPHELQHLAALALGDWLLKEGYVDELLDLS